MHKGGQDSDIDAAGCKQNAGSWLLDSGKHASLERGKGLLKRINANIFKLHSSFKYVTTEGFLSSSMPNVTQH